MTMRLFTVRLLVTMGLCAAFLLGGCGGQSTTTTGSAPDNPPEMESALHYIKASNTGLSDSFGESIALSADGTTLAVGAPWESSDAVGINKDQGNDNRAFSGAVYVFVRSGKTWVQQAYIKASNPGEFDRFGSSVALSTNGHTLAVGANWESSSKVSDPFDDDARHAGAVYVFARNDGEWHQQSYLKADQPTPGGLFGRSLSLSGSGDTLAVGAPAIDIDSGAGDGATRDGGAAYVFTRSGVGWSQQARLILDNREEYDQFGHSVSLSEVGDTLAVGAIGRSVMGDPGDNLPLYTGAAYVFKRTALAWSQDAQLKASNPGEFDKFGFSIVLSADGNTVAVGATGEASKATTINGPLEGQRDDSLSEAGAVYVFTHSGGLWAQQAYVKASNAGAYDQFGFALALSGNGNALMVGAVGEASKAMGINGEQGDDSAPWAGAVYVFTRAADTWSQRAYVKPSNTGEFDRFGNAVAVSGGGQTFAVGAPAERSKATGIDGDQLDDSINQAGAVYVLNTLD